MYIQIYWLHHVMICDPGKVGNRNSIQGEFEMVLLKREIHVRAHLFRELAYLFVYPTIYIVSARSFSNVSFDRPIDWSTRGPLLRTGSDSSYVDRLTR